MSDDIVVGKEPTEVENKWLDFKEDQFMNADERFDKLWDRLTVICLGILTAVTISFRAFNIEICLFNILPVIILGISLLLSIYKNLPTKVSVPSGMTLEMIKKQHDERLVGRRKSIVTAFYLFFIGFTWALLVIYTGKTTV